MKKCQADFKSKFPKCKPQDSARMKNLHRNVRPVLFTQGKEVSAAPSEVIHRGCLKETGHEEK